MNLSRRRSIGLVLTGIAGTQFPRASSAAEQAGAVSWEGLGTTTKIVGRLGKPLGDLLRIVGTTVGADHVRDKGEADAVLLRVAAVEGRQVKDSPVLRLQFFEFLGLEEDIPASTKLSLLGYEDGNLRGIPRAAMEHIGQDGGVVPATQGWHFSTHFQVLKNLGAPANARRQPPRKA